MNLLRRLPLPRAPRTPSILFDGVLAYVSRDTGVSFDKILGRSPARIVAARLKLWGMLRASGWSDRRIVAACASARGKARP